MDIIRTFADIIKPFPSRLIGSGSFKPGVSGDDGRWYSTSSFLATGDLLYGYNSGYHINNFIRFPSVAIPAGAVIHSASITIKSLSSRSGTMVNDIYFNDENDAAAPTNWSTANGKVKTAATVQWTAGTWVNGTQYTTPDLKDIIQEVVDRPGWASGNAMMALILDNESLSSDWRSVVGYDSDPTYAPTLNVVYDYAP
jgi:hypothetical protein